MTNIEKIKSMTVEELAAYIDKISFLSVCKFCVYNVGSIVCELSEPPCCEGIAKWLESEAEDECTGSV